MALNPVFNISHWSPDMNIVALRATTFMCGLASFDPDHLGTKFYITALLSSALSKHLTWDEVSAEG
jgi:hypothetical protein